VSCLGQILDESRRMLTTGRRQGLRIVLNLPELNLALFAFLLNFVWEMLQIPFFRGMTQAPHWDALLICLQATLGDVGVALAAFWTIAWLGRDRHWPTRPRPAQIAAFALVGILITTALEWLATQVWSLWSYSGLMPMIPFLGVGLVPLLQWIVLPPLIIWFVHRQLT
jgi:hypothetical protein